MKNAVILHCYGGSKESFWYPWVGKKLSERGYLVSIPNLPNTDDPKLEEQLEFCLKNLKFDEETVLIGHSSGCPLILAILEKIPVKVKQVLFVAGYATPLKVASENTKNIKPEFDWKTIKEYSEKFIFINSVNDPWGADDKQGKLMFDKLGGIQIINQEGHMGSDSFNQPYKEFPFLVKLID